MGRFSERQLVVATLVVALLLAAGFGALIWMDYQEIHKAEITDDHPEASEVTDPEEWGQLRRIHEIEEQMKVAKIDADKIPKLETDVIVNREIVARDSQILPDVDDVNNLARMINDFETQSGVQLSTVLDLSVKPGGEAIKTMPFKLQISGTFDQFLKFLNLFESMDRIVNTRGFSIAAGKTMGTGSEKRAVHEIQLELVTYIYTSTAGITKPVDIANYDKRKDDQQIQKLVRQQKPARVEKYQLKPRINRRDPFVDPRRSSVAAADTASPEDVDKQKRLVERLKLDVELLKEDVRTEQTAFQNKQYVLVATLKQVIDQKCAKLDADIGQTDPTITLPEQREIFHEEVLAPFEKIKAERKLFSLPPIFSKHHAEDFQLQMRKHMEAREYEQVVKLLGAFETAVKGREIAEDAHDVVADMQAMAKEARVMMQFLALKIKVTGMILRDAGSMVIVNSKAKKVGEFVDPANRCRLKEIRDDKLVFELDGIEIEHDLDKK